MSLSRVRRWFSKKIFLSSAKLQLRVTPLLINVLEAYFLHMFHTYTISLLFPILGFYVLTSFWREGRSDARVVPLELLQSSKCRPCSSRRRLKNTSYPQTDVTQSSGNHWRNTHTHTHTHTHTIVSLTSYDRDLSIKLFHPITPKYLLRSAICVGSGGP